MLRSSCPPKRLIISRSIHMSSCPCWIQIVIPNVSCLWGVCGQSTLLNRFSFFETGVENQRWCQKPSLSCACTRELLSDVGSFFGFLVEQGEFFFCGYLPNGSFGIQPCLVELSPLSCGGNSAWAGMCDARRSFLECHARMGCVRSLGVSLMTRSLNKAFSWWNEFGGCWFGIEHASDL